MGIKIKHAPSAAAIGESAYTIGRGQRRERDIRFATDVALRKQSLGLQAMSIAIGARRSSRQLDLQEERLEFRKEQWQEEPGRQLELSLQAQKRLQENTAHEYSEAQKNERARIIGGLGWIDAEVIAGRMTPEQGEKLSGKAWAKYYGIHPYPVDKEPSLQQIYDSEGVTDSTTGRKLRRKTNGEWYSPGDISFKDYAKLYTDTLKALTIDGLAPSQEEVNKRINEIMGGHAKIQGNATRAEEIQGRQEQEQERLDVEKQQQKQQTEKKAAVEALPTLFKTLTGGQPKIGRKKKGKPSLWKDDVFGEEAYDKIFAEAVTRLEPLGIAPEVIKQKLNEWWDAEYDKERGQSFQKFGNRMKFEGASREAAYGQRADGTPKGPGFLGELAVQDGKVATEYSIGVEFDGKETEIPTLVPTLTKDELNLMVKDIIPNKKEVPKAIVKKAIDHAKQRMKQGKSPFAEPGETAPETEKVKMKAPNGETYEVDRSEVEESEKHGWVTF